MLTTLFQRILNWLSHLKRSEPSDQSRLPSGSLPDSLDSAKPTLSPSEIKRLEKMHRFEEGVKSTPYFDSRGFETIGIGHLMDQRIGGYLPAYARNELSAKGRLSDTVISRLYEEDLNRTVDDLLRYLPWVFRLDPVRRDVLIDMCFQMGIGSPETGEGLRGFKNTLRYIQNGDYTQAARNMELSAWYKQTPNRAKRRINEMKTGVAFKYA